MVYYNYSIPYSEIEALYHKGPGKVSCQKDKNLEVPPYLTSNWWVNSYQSGAPEYG